MTRIPELHDGYWCDEHNTWTNRAGDFGCGCDATADLGHAHLLYLHNRAEEAATTALEAAQARNREIVAAVGRGVRVRDVARLLDLSESRVHAIVKREGR